MESNPPAVCTKPKDLCGRYHENRKAKSVREREESPSSFLSTLEEATGRHRCGPDQAQSESLPVALLLTTLIDVLLLEMTVPCLAKQWPSTLDKWRQAPEPYIHKCRCGGLFHAWHPVHRNLRERETQRDPVPTLCCLGVCLSLRQGKPAKIIINRW